MYLLADVILDMELQNNRLDRAAKHFIIAAKLGDGDSLEAAKSLYKDGHVTKDDFAAALRGHKAAIDATESLRGRKPQISSTGTIGSLVR